MFGLPNQYIIIRLKRVIRLIGSIIGLSLGLSLVLMLILINTAHRVICLLIHLILVSTRIHTIHPFQSISQIETPFVVNISLNPSILIPPSDLFINRKNFYSTVFSLLIDSSVFSLLYHLLQTKLIEKMVFFCYFIFYSTINPLLLYKYFRFVSHVIKT